MNNTQQATEVWTVPGWDEELRCESQHWGSVCSVEVTHITNDCRDRVMRVCTVSAQNHLMQMAEGLTCPKCMRQVSKCWTVRPI